MSHATTQLILKFRKSGLSQKDFAKAQKIPLSTLQYHIYKKSTRKEPTVSEPKFIALTSPAVSLPVDKLENTIVIIRGIFTPNQISEIINAGGSL